MAWHCLWHHQSLPAITMECALGLHMHARPPPDEHPPSHPPAVYDPTGKTPKPSDHGAPPHLRRCSGHDKFFASVSRVLSHASVCSHHVSRHRLRIAPPLTQSPATHHLPAAPRRLHIKASIGCHIIPGATWHMGMGLLGTCLLASRGLACVHHRRCLQAKCSKPSLSTKAVWSYVTTAQMRHACCVDSCCCARC